MLFEQWSDPDGLPGLAGKTVPRRSLVCAGCGAGITDPAAAIRIGDAHHHVFTNPAGMVFEIGCFREAPGCRCAGTPTLEWTWFAGRAWRYAHCRACGVHLGWHYRGDGDDFFGLILLRLTERH